MTAVLVADAPPPPYTAGPAAGGRARAGTGGRSSSEPPAAVAAGFDRLDRALAVIGQQVLDGAVSDRDLAVSVERLQQIETQVAAEKLRRIAELDTRSAATGLGARSTADLLATRLGLTKGEAKATAETAAALEELPKTAAKLRRGQIGVGQAQTAARVLGRMGVPDDDTVEAFDALAASSGGSQNRNQLNDTLEAFAHSRGSDHLADRDRRAWQARRVRRWTDRVTGMRRYDIALPVVGGAVLDAAIDAVLARDRAVGATEGVAGATEGAGDGADGRSGDEALGGAACDHGGDAHRSGERGDGRTFEQRAADAVVALAQHALDTAGLPTVAGHQPHVLMIITEPAADGAPGAAPPVIDGAGPVSSATAQQLLCDAEVTAVTMIRNHEVLDVGRSRRDPTLRQRAAVIARDRSCIGCGAAALRCQIHHVRWWDRDHGATDESNLTLLCASCHHHVHHHGWTVKGDHIRGFTLDRTPTGPRLPHRRRP